MVRVIMNNVQAAASAIHMLEEFTGKKDETRGIEVTAKGFCLQPSATLTKTASTAAASALSDLKLTSSSGVDENNKLEIPTNVSASLLAALDTDQLVDLVMTGRLRLVDLKLAQTGLTILLDRTKGGSPSADLSTASDHLELAIEKIELQNIHKALQNIAPMGKEPMNCRVVFATVKDQHQPVLMMAHPALYANETTKDEALSKIRNAGYKVLISFNDYEFSEIKRAWEIDPNYKIHLVAMDDWQPPSKGQLTRLQKIVDETTKQGKSFALYCGAGYGRSGTMLSGIILHDLVTKEIKNPNFSNPPLARTDELLVEVDEGKSFETIMTTPNVANAVKMARSADPHPGHISLLALNNSSAKDGNSCETEGQVRALEAYEAALRAEVRSNAR